MSHPAWEPPKVGALTPTYRHAESLPAVVEEYRYDPPRVEIQSANRFDANLICSDLPDGRHMIVLDVDHDAALVPSSTPGHHHLYLALPLSWRQYRRLLRALYKAGVIQRGFYAAAKRRGYTSVRPPWVTKEPLDSPTGVMIDCQT